jgi:hypothetical protein
MINYFENNEILLEDFSYWEDRKLYMQLMEKFVYYRINGMQFDKEFCQMWKVNRDRNYTLKEMLNKIEYKELTQLEDFSDFSDLISDVFSDCEVFQPNSRLRKRYEISEEELRNRVKKTLLEIKDRYP